jgi:hypothetical protein
MGFIIAPALSPFAFGFLVARAKLVVSLSASGSVLLTTLLCQLEMDIWSWLHVRLIYCFVNRLFRT